MNPKDLIKNKEKKIERFKYLDNKGQNILPVDEKKRDNWYEWFELKKKLPVLKASLKALKQMNKLWEDKLKDEGIIFLAGEICFDEKASPKFAKWLDKLLDKREKYTNKSWLDRIDEKKKDSKKLIKEISKHRCRAKTGNWCLDCERLHSKATGIFNTCEELKSEDKK